MRRPRGLLFADLSAASIGRGGRRKQPGAASISRNTAAHFRRFSRRAPRYASGGSTSGSTRRTRSYFFTAGATAGRGADGAAGLSGESTFCTSVPALMSAAFMSSGTIGRHFTSPASVR